jgi:hypothetical protein
MNELRDKLKSILCDKNYAEFNCKIVVNEILSLIEKKIDECKTLEELKRKLVGGKR